jgi:tRNA 2-thiouridine synthesizing protein A
MNGDDGISNGPGSTDPVDITLDERGKRCPLPVIALARAAQEHPGQRIDVWSDDPAAEHDVPAWCRMRNAVFIGAYDLGDGGRGYAVRSPGN